MERVSFAKWISIVSLAWLLSSSFARAEEAAPRVYEIQRRIGQDCRSEVFITRSETNFRVSFALDRVELETAKRWSGVLGEPARHSLWIVAASEAGPTIVGAGGGGLAASLLRTFFAREAPRFVYRRFFLISLLIGGGTSVMERWLGTNGNAEDHAALERFLRFFRPYETTIPNFINEIYSEVLAQERVAVNGACAGRDWPAVLADSSFVNALSTSLNIGLEVRRRLRNP